MEWYVNTEWQMERKGIHKRVLELNFSNLEKPHLVSKVLVIIEDVNNLNDRPSAFLSGEKICQEQQIEMGTALTPVDCYVEILLQQMIVGERAICNIKTRTQSEDESITFIITLKSILESREIFNLNLEEMYGLALRYKENGVTMFKKFPVFAHDYFMRAAKCLISYKPFEGLTKKEDGVDSNTLQDLFIQIQTNLAACLLTQRRYEDVIYQTQFVDKLEKPSEKSVYRRAMAYYHLKEFEKAQQLIEKVENYKDKKDFIKLHQCIAESWKSSNDTYKHLVQRMFS